jgi:hypothetical protein
MSACVRVTVEERVSLHVVSVQVVMVMCREFGRRYPAMSVIVSMRSRCFRIDLMTAVRAPHHSLPVVRETHLHGTSDSRLLVSRRKLRLCPEIHEAAVTFGKPRAYDQRLENVERRAIRRRAPQDLIQQFLCGASGHIGCQSLHTRPFLKRLIRYH